MTERNNPSPTPQEPPEPPQPTDCPSPCGLGQYGGCRRPAGSASFQPPVPDWVNRLGHLLIESAVVIEDPPEERSLEDQRMERFINALGRRLVKPPRRPTVHELLMMDGRALDAAMELMR